MKNKTKKNIKFIVILLIALICGMLVVFGGLLGLDLYLENTVEPTKSELLISAMGEFTEKEQYSYGWWQDRGMYSKYTYESADLNNEYLSPVTENDMGEISLRITDFRWYVSSSGTSEDDKSLYENYDFLLSVIDTNDYWFIEYGETDTRDFEMFIFDTETNVLYRFAYSI